MLIFTKFRLDELVTNELGLFIDNVLHHAGDSSSLALYLKNVATL